MEFSDTTRFASLILVVLLLCLNSGCSQNVTSCKLGECIGALACPALKPAINLYSLTRFKYIIDILKPHRCGDSESVSVCCTDIEADLIANNILSNQTDRNRILVLGKLIKTHSFCGISSGSDRIINGETAFLYEFPWMALLEFNTTKGTSFLCGGSLISDRYVLTAAHCFTPPGAQLVNVRLGEYNTSSEIDCEHAFIGSDQCLPPAQDYQVEDVLIHREFKSSLFLNDIALVRLKENVTYGDRILPICLPIWKHFKEKIEFAEVAGWGLTVSGRPAEVLQKATLPVLPNDFCGKTFSRNLTSSFLCAGGERGTDTCKGDSGGPLFQRDSKRPARFVLHGILSAGGAVCGGNNTVPSIYANVVEYMPWIIENMKP